MAARKTTARKTTARKKAARPKTPPLTPDRVLDRWLYVTCTTCRNCGLAGSGPDVFWADRVPTPAGAPPDDVRPWYMIWRLSSAVVDYLLDRQAVLLTWEGDSVLDVPRRPERIVALDGWDRLPPPPPDFVPLTEAHQGNLVDRGRVPAGMAVWAEESS